MWIKKLCSIFLLSIIFLLLCSCGNTQDKITHKKDTQDKLVPDKIMEETNLDIEGRHYEWIRYCLEDGGIRLIGLRTKEDVLVIPASIQGYPVTRIGGTNKEIIAEHFYAENEINAAAGDFHIWNTDKDQKLKRIIISEGVREIVNEGMAYAGVEQLILPESLVLVDERTFIGSKISNVLVKGEKTELYPSSFMNTCLREITFPEDFQGRLCSDCFSETPIETFFVRLV